jgi:parallel beta-helix repeat protein
MFDNDFGLETDTQANLEISHNDIFGNLADAITLCGDLLSGCGPATGIVVRSNDIRNNGGSGITLFGADANLLKSNHIEDNGVTPDDTTDGIRVDIFSENNQIVDNHMQGNITHDCHDDSMGGGTAGTANTWQGDRGNTENRAGLCRVN